MTTFGHFVALLVLFSTIDNNINLSLPDSYSQEERQQAVNTAWAALIFSFICFVFDFVGMFFGTSLFYTKGNLLQIFFHFVGGIFLSWLLTSNWNYKALWPIVIACNLPTALYELCVLLGVHVFKIIIY
jgi:hypothetical protein